MNKLMTVFLLIFFPGLAWCDFAGLAKGITLTPSNDVAIISTNIEYASADINHEKFNDGLVVSFLRPTGTDYIFSISEKTVLHLTDRKDDASLGRWSLGHWSPEPIEQEVLSRYELVSRTYMMPLNIAADTPLGCLNASPLRYGDIDNDSDNELVLMLGNDLLVFSPTVKQVVFMVGLRVDDWFDEAGTANYFKLHPFEGDSPVLPQYQSAANPDHLEALPGYRGYAKLYTGDFDKDGYADILVWRKLYLSNMTNNSQKGFTKQKDSFYHYKRALKTTSEYQLLATEQTQIKTWLSDNQLTWQKGYPNLSECPGQTSQHIPEMIDPLLNDPDVLK